MTTWMVHTRVDRALALAKAGLPTDDWFTFDDGLVHVYMQRHELAALKQRVTVLVVRDYAELGYPPGDLNVYYQDDRVFNHRSQFMTVDQLRELAELGIELGAHSAAHAVVLVPGKSTPPKRLWRLAELTDDQKHLRVLARVCGTMSALATPGVVVENGGTRKRTEAEFVNYVQTDTHACITWFTATFGYRPLVYAMPFNQTSSVLLDALTDNGVTDMVGAERVDLDTMADNVFDNLILTLKRGSNL